MRCRPAQVAIIAATLGASMLAGCTSSTGSAASDASRSASPVPVQPGSPQPIATGCAQPANEYADRFEERNVVVAVPGPSSGTGERGRPVVVALHGYNGQAQDFAAYTGLDAAARAAGVVAIFPQGSSTSAGGSGWNYPRHAQVGADDVGFLDRLLAKYQTQLCLDLTRVVVTGWSDGADMAVSYACHGKIALRGILMVAAATGGTRACHARSVVYVHGTADPIEPYNGGGVDNRPGYGNQKSLGAQAMTKSWADAMQCAAPTNSGSAPVTAQTYAACRGGGQVALYSIQGGGHPWPSARYDINAKYGPTNHTYKTNLAVLALLA